MDTPLVSTVMDADVRNALLTDLTIDLTTTGRRNGSPHRIEIWLLAVDGHLYLTGTPGPRDWFANLLANPHCTIHLKQKIHADVPAKARRVTAQEHRLHVFEHRDAKWYLNQGDDFDDMLNEAPMVELEVDL